MDCLAHGGRVVVLLPPVLTGRSSPSLGARSACLQT
jgi:hypothetical protein